MKAKVYIELTDSCSEEEINKRGVQASQLQEIFTESFQNFFRLYHNPWIRNIPTSGRNR